MLSLFRRVLNYFRNKSEARKGLCAVGRGYALTSVNTSIFRKSSIISHGKSQYVSFYNAKGYVVLGKRNLGKRRWKLKRLPFKGKISDAHNVISIGIDGDGYLHIAYGMHNAPLNYLRSESPGKMKMKIFDRCDGVEENRVTYPEFYTLPSGDLLFVYRSGSSGNGNMVVKRYRVKEKQWETMHKSLIDGSGERNAYWQLCVDPRGVIHVSWVWRETNDVATNHDLCYARSVDGGKTWQRSDGQNYRLPIDEKNAEVVWSIPQNSELMNQTSMAADKEGNVFIATYWRDSDSSVPQYRVVWNKGRGWKMSQAGERHTPFSLKGFGTKMVPISRPVVLTRDNELLLLFRDEERGSKAALGVCADIEKGEWKFRDITDFNVEAWEPSYDPELLKNSNILNVYIQTTYQGDEEKVADRGSKTTPVWIWQE